MTVPASADLKFGSSRARDVNKCKNYTFFFFIILRKPRTLATFTEQGINSGSGENLFGLRFGAPPLLWVDHRNRPWLERDIYFSVKKAIPVKPLSVSGIVRRDAYKLFYNIATSKI